MIAVTGDIMFLIVVAVVTAGLIIFEQVTRPDDD